ncbi:MAG: cysteine-rich small domain-containing protein [Bacteroidota bacterium]|nr:cysteine-rich small domain-containing protein [Bacteroidota bacterium]
MIDKTKSDEEMINHLAEFGIEAHKCKYYPCHETLESCATCYCPFYEYCQQLPEKIRDRYGIMGYFLKEDVYACELCTWIHRQDVVDFIRNNKSKSPGQIFTEALRKFGG